MPLLPRRLLAMAATLALTACNHPDKGTTVTINTDDGNSIASVDGNSGQVKLAIPGFTGKIDLPKLQLDASNFDMNGVHLYPGSTIDTVDIGNAGKDGGVRIAFTSPATPDQVRDWFQARLSKVGFTVKPDGRGLSGSTDENKPFTLTLTGQGADKATGTIRLGS